MKSGYIIVFVTAKDSKEAQSISEKLLQEKLIACANISENIESFFWWDKKIDRSKEVLLILKSHEKVFKKIVQTVKAVHSYQVPEIISLPILDGNPDYLKWIDESIG